MADQFMRVLHVPLEHRSVVLYGSSDRLLTLAVLEGKLVLPILHPYGVETVKCYSVEYFFLKHGVPAEIPKYVSYGGLFHLGLPGYVVPTHVFGMARDL